MPNVAVQTGVSFQDAQGVRASVNLVQDLSDATLISALVTQNQALLTALDGVSGAAIVGSRVTVLPAFPGGLKAAIAGVDIEKTLLINFAQAGLSHKYGIDIPGVTPQTIGGAAGPVIVGDTPQIAQAALVALIALIEGNYTSAALNALTAVRDYAVTFRKHRRGLARVATVA